MAFGQGATVLTPIEQAVAYSTFANYNPATGSGTRYAPQVASEVVDPVTGKVVKKLAPQVTGQRHDLTDQLRGHAGGLRGCDLEPARHCLRRLPGVPDLVEPGRQDRDGLQRAGPRAQLVVRRLRPEPQSPVPRPGGHRPGRVRRRRSGARWCATSSTTWPPTRSARRSRPRRRPARRAWPPRPPTPRSGRRPRPRRCPARRRRATTTTSTTQTPGG